MSFSISVKDYAISAGQTLRIQIPGTFFQLMEASAEVDVLIMRAHSIFGDAEAVPLGFSVGPLNDADAFDGVEIYSATAQTVKVCIARGAVDLRSITQVTGTVSVVNGELQDVLSGMAFVGACGNAAVAGQYSHSELFNPAGSGVNVVVSKVIPFVAAASPVQLRTHNAALTTLTGYGVNKLVGGAASVAQLRDATSAALIGAYAANAGIPTASDSKEIPLPEPFVLPPGFGLMAVSNLVNISLYPTFHWKEVPL